MSIFSRLLRKPELTPEQKAQEEELKQERAKAFHQEALKQVRIVGARHAIQRFNPPKQPQRPQTDIFGGFGGTPTIINPNIKRKPTITYKKVGKHYKKIIHYNKPKQLISKPLQMPKPFDIDDYNRKNRMRY